LSFSFFFLNHFTCVNANLAQVCIFMEFYYFTAIFLKNNNNNNFALGSQNTPYQHPLDKNVPIETH